MKLTAEELKLGDEELALIAGKLKIIAEEPKLTTEELKLIAGEPSTQEDKFQVYTRKGKLHHQNGWLLKLSNSLAKILRFGHGNFAQEPTGKATLAYSKVFNLYIWTLNQYTLQQKAMVTMAVVSDPSKNNTWLSLVKTLPVDCHRGCLGAPPMSSV